MPLRFLPHSVGVGALIDDSVLLSVCLSVSIKTLDLYSTEGAVVIGNVTTRANNRRHQIQLPTSVFL